MVGTAEMQEQFLLITRDWWYTDNAAVIGQFFAFISTMSIGGIKFIFPIATGGKLAYAGLIQDKTAAGIASDKPG